MTLLAAYAYDEGSGSTTADATGNGHTATLNNATFTTGHTNSGITNTATTQGATSTVPAVTSAAVTLMAWVKPLDLAAGTSHLAVGILQSFNGSTDIGLWTQRGDFGTANVLQGNIRINGNLSAVNGAALTVGTWAHLALTYDGTTIRLYKDGTQVATVSNSGPISLGTTLYVAGGGPDTDVVVDDVRYYNEVLDATAISTAMNTPVGGGAVTGTGSVTAPPATSSGAGSVIVAGTGAAAAAPATASGTGSVIVAGTGSAMAPLAAVAGAGTVIVAGSGSATAPPPTAAGSGAVIVTGSGAATAPPAVVFGAGGAAPTIDGNGNLVAPTAIITGTGAVVITGTGSVVAPAAVVHGFDQAVQVATDARLTIQPNGAMLTAAVNRAVATIEGG